jgi:hypothetical protein
MTEQEHLDEGALARFVDNTVGDDERTQIESHLADCAVCREDLAETRRVLRTQPRRRRWVPLVPLAAAAMVLLLLWTGGGHQAPIGTVTRDPALTNTLAPRPIAPIGNVSRLDSLQWSAVPGAHRYALTVFSGDGRTLWQTTLSDTAVALPESLRFSSLSPYYWRIKAETAFGRWVESDLVTFMVTAERAPR